MQRPQHVDELLAEPVLEVDPAALDPARDQQHLLVLDVDALDRPDPLREVEDLGLGERLGRVPAALALPDHRRVEALLDRRPDRERGREVVAVDDEVGAVADADRVDLGEELVGGVAGEDVREPRLDADADEREPAGLLPAPASANWASPSFSPGRGVRERHRQVEVGAAGLERAWKIGGLKRGSTAFRIASARSARASSAIAAESEASTAAAAKRGSPYGRPRAGRRVDVGEHDPLEEVAPLRHRRDRRADSARSDDENAHGRGPT